MGAPKLPTVYNQSMTQRIDEFYGNSSIFKNNMFYVGLWGEYVDDALNVMAESTKRDPFLNQSRSGQTKGADVFDTAFKRWKSVHVDDDTHEVELKWTCSQITIPTVESQFETKDYSIDTIKPIQYPLLTGYGGAKNVDITIVEDRNMMLWHFFNTLHNQFYNAQELIPKSSFHKVGMYCAVMQSDVLTNAPDSIKDGLEWSIDEFGVDRLITDVPAMVYEFNSVLITEVGKIQLSQDQPDKFTFTVQIQVPNTFQGTFKTQFRGLANNSSQGGYVSTSGVDASAIKNGSYNKAFFEEGGLPIDRGGKGDGGGQSTDRKGNISKINGNKSTLNTNLPNNTVAKATKNLN